MKPRVGVSACLLGHLVRYDGGHKWDADVVALAERVEFVAVCPEDEVGMGTPREPITLDCNRRLVGVRSRRDHTDAMTVWANKRLAELGPLDGYILKARSPSCGLAGAQVEGEGPVGRGLFAQVLTDALPDLPVVEEDDVDEGFVERVFEHFRLRQRESRSQQR